MDKYKRLTGAEGYDCETDFCWQCKYQGEPNGCNNPNGECGNYNRFCEMYGRLCEMENQIEDGTLVELSCKVGDKLYKITTVFGKKVVQPLYVYGFHCDGRKLWIVDCTSEKDNHLYSVFFDEIGSAYFLTKAEAEAKLKELRNESGI